MLLSKGPIEEESTYSRSLCRREKKCQEQYKTEGGSALRRGECSKCGALTLAFFVVFVNFFYLFETTIGTAGAVQSSVANEIHNNNALSQTTMLFH